MGKKLRQQRRGKGSNVYTKLPNTFDISVGFEKAPDVNMSAEVIDIFNHTGHTAPLMCVVYEDMDKGFYVAPEGIKIGDKIFMGPDAKPVLGSIVRVGDMPEGAPVYNIEVTKGDGGKLVRSAGAFAVISAKSERSISIKLPSKQTIMIDPDCRAQLGMVAGAGITDQPIPSVEFPDDRILNDVLRDLSP